MTEIIRGTTPTIQYYFSTVNPSLLEIAILKLSQSGNVIIQKGLDSANISGKSISWTFSQEETLLLNENRVLNVTLDWLLNDGTRGAAKKAILDVTSSGTNEVISSE